MSDLKLQAKKRVGLRVAGWIEDGMTIGLGTGSTAAEAITALGYRIVDESLKIRGVATSFASERMAIENHISLVSLEDVDRLDIAFDGADEVDTNLNLIKGRGAAQTREKIVAGQADRFVVLVDESKMVKRLGEKMPLPVEIVPMALAPVSRVLRQYGARVELRMGSRKDGPVVSDQGLWIVDAAFDNPFDAEEINRVLLSTPGVLDHGLFLDMATDVLVGLPDGSLDHHEAHRSVS
jgi:ribose 5-phosphate isomerase A